LHPGKKIFIQQVLISSLIKRQNYFFFFVFGFAFAFAFVFFLAAMLVDLKIKIYFFK